MTLTEAFLHENVYIDFGSDLQYGEDQAFINYPVRFATVEIPLIATEGLERIADRIRKDRGFRPIRPMDEFNESTCDQDAWYDFYVDLVSWPGYRTGNCIYFIVANSDQPDNEETYTIDLTEEEQAYMYCRLDEQLQKYTDKSCAGHLVEATKEMESMS
ncbi:MAG: hypothetical protein IJV40_15750 [Oscillospiraceae bacterium]|nr:hypothetical protein [Oscillospiraceae bacterium]